MATLIRTEADTKPSVAARAGGRRPLRLALALLALIALLALDGLLIGTPALSPGQLWEVLAEGGGERLARVVVLQLRLPRLVLRYLETRLYT